MGIKGKRTLAILVLFVFVVLIGQTSYTGYINFRDTVVEQQQEHLLTIARSVRDSISRYIDMRLSDLSFLASVQFDAETMDAMMDEMVSSSDLNFLLFLDDKGNMINSVRSKTYTNSEMDAFVESEYSFALDSEDGFVGTVHLDNNGEFAVNIYLAVVDPQGRRGVLAASLPIQKMYQEIVAPVKAGEEGYAMVKDQNGTIIMHPVPEQIGYDVIDTRKKIYPELDYIELEKLIDRQLSGEEGVAIYHSYWWTHEVLNKTKKLSAFTPVQLSDGNFWVIAVVMSYSEIQAPILRYLVLVISAASILILMFGIAMYMLFKMRKKQEAYEMEMAYLKQINESSEELRIKESELEHSRKLRTIGTLTSGISHDFNNLLTPIMGHSEIILHRMDKDSPFYDGIQDIYNASFKAKELIEQILLFSRLNKEKKGEKELSLNEILKDTVKFFKPVLSSNIKLMEQITDSKNVIIGNDSEVKQVVMNLLTNAYHAMKDTGGILTVRLEQLEQHGKQFAVITVADTGCGMDDETKAQIFDPFFTSKPAGEGTGLGLSMVQSVLEKYNGRIYVQSAPNKGSTFEIVFPLRTSKAAIVDEEEAKSAKGIERILLVDDNPDITKVFSMGLGMLGYRVTSFNNSLEGLREFTMNSGLYKALVLDESMPYMTGLNLAMKAKEIKEDIKIVIVTAHQKKSLIKALDGKEIDALMIKPVTAKDIALKLRELWEEQ